MRLISAPLLLLAACGGDLPTISGTSSVYLVHAVENMTGHVRAFEAGTCGATFDGAASSSAPQRILEILLPRDATAQCNLYKNERSGDALTVTSAMRCLGQIEELEIDADFAKVAGQNPPITGSVHTSGRLASGHCDSWYDLTATAFVSVTE